MPMKQLTDSANHTLKQLKGFLSQIEEREYVQHLPILFESTIGMHVRHIIEFYQCLVKGILQGEMDYDARERSLLQETNIQYAQACIDNLLIDLTLIQENNDIVLLTEQNQTAHKLSIQSNVARELSYVIEHTIHHFAIIKMGCMVAFPHIQFHNDFGVAYSTIKYRERVHSNVSA
jgi:uncharacterized damage-inducible protein DinB